MEPVLPRARRATVDHVLSAEEHEEVFWWLAGLQLPFPLRTIAAPAYRRVLAELGRPVPPPVGDGNGFCFVSHLGQVCPSGFLQIPGGNVRDHPLAYWYRHHPLFVALRDVERLEGKCGICEYRHLCGGSRARAWSMTGNPFAEDPPASTGPAAAASPPPSVASERCRPAGTRNTTGSSPVVGEFPARDAGPVPSPSARPSFRAS